MRFCLSWIELHCCVYVCARSNVFCFVLVVVFSSFHNDFFSLIIFVSRDYYFDRKKEVGMVNMQVIKKSDDLGTLNI